MSMMIALNFYPTSQRSQEESTSTISELIPQIRKLDISRIILIEKMFNKAFICPTQKVMKQTIVLLGIICKKIS